MAKAGSEPSSGWSRWPGPRPKSANACAAPASAPFRLGTKPPSCASGGYFPASERSTWPARHDSRDTCAPFFVSLSDLLFDAECDASNRRYSCPYDLSSREYLPLVDNLPDALSDTKNQTTRHGPPPSIR